MSIAQNLSRVQDQIAEACQRAGRDPSAVQLIAVSKTFPTQAIADAVEAGHTQFGENRVQEGLAKLDELDSLSITTDIHLIGHLQRNKARHAGRFASVQSVDSVALAQAISRRLDHELSILLEVNVGEEASKFGFRCDDVPTALKEVQALPHLRVEGLMTVAPEVADAEDIRPIFRRLRELAQQTGLSQLSMGMSNDYAVAIEEGATMVRIGRAIFGTRTGDAP